MRKPKKEYLPGVCNIGSAETRARLYMGWMGLVATAVLWTILVALKAPPYWGLTVFLSAAGGALGFLQTLMHFCAMFGLRGVFNLGVKTGEITSVGQEEFRRADRRQAVRLLVYSALIGTAAAATAVLTLVFVNYLT
jgi:hypothetical protein